jgi:hypothetical protein
VIFLIADFSHNSVTPHIFTDSKYNDDAKRDNVMMVYSKSYAHSNRNKVSAHDSGLIGNVCFFLSPTKSPLQVLILASYEDDVGKRNLVMMAYSRSYAYLKISKKIIGFVGNPCMASHGSSGAEIENCRTQFMNEDLFGKPKGMLHSTQCGATVASTVQELYAYCAKHEPQCSCWDIWDIWPNDFSIVLMNGYLHYMFAGSSPHIPKI